MGSKGSRGVAGKIEERSGPGILLAVVNIDKSYICWKSRGNACERDIYQSGVSCQRLVNEASKYEHLLCT
jgi:hypothetical protein